MSWFWTILWAVVTAVLLWFYLRREAWDERGRKISLSADSISHSVLIIGFMLLFILYPWIHLNYVMYRAIVQIIVVVGIAAQALMLLYQRRKL